jgi:hypothetical protein
MAHIDRRTVFLDGALDDLDRPFDASTEPPRLSQEAADLLHQRGKPANYGIHTHL